MEIVQRLSKSNIEYLDYIWGFYSGSRVLLSRPPSENEVGVTAITEGFKQRLRNILGTASRQETVLSPLHLPKPSRIGVSLMDENLEEWIDPDSSLSSSDGSSARDMIFNVISRCPQHVFVFLTRHPAKLRKWSPFPDNCWVGVAASDYAEARWAARELRKVEAGIRFLSFEPLLAPAAVLPSTLVVSGIGWATIGAEISPYHPLDIGWVEEIVEVCDMAEVPVFLSSNLKSAFFKQKGIDSSHLLNSRLGVYKLRQEWPRTGFMLPPDRSTV